MVKPDFDKVYNENKENVWALVSRYVFYREDREDLFQEVFVNIHKALHKFRGDSSISTWIYRVAVNTAINYSKKQQRNKFLLNVLSSVGILKDEHNDKYKEDEIEDLIPLKKLNPQQRMVVLLADVEERKLDEISQIMKLPVGTVKSTLHRAREILRKEIEKNGQI